MPLDFITHNGVGYPKHEAEGNAARWIMPMALEYCKGFGFDVGANRVEWAFPGCFMMIDPAITPELNAMVIPCEDNYADYIFSSHCLEHVKENWYNVLDYWLTKIKVGGIIFLYLPHSSQTYWHPSSNRKHIHSFSGDEIGSYLRSLGHKVFVGGCDANHSFVVICEKMPPPIIEGKEVTYVQYKTFIDELELISHRYPMLNFNGPITGPDAADFMRERFNLIERMGLR